MKSTAPGRQRPESSGRRDPFTGQSTPSRAEKLWFFAESFLLFSKGKGDGFSRCETNMNKRCLDFSVASAFDGQNQVYR